jgi:hypothetical protein
MASSTHDGYPAFYVPNSVTSFKGYGMGSYCYFDQGVAIYNATAFQAPDTSGVMFHEFGDQRHQLYTAAREPKELWLLPRMGHAESACQQDLVDCIARRIDQATQPAQTVTAQVAEPGSAEISPAEANQEATTPDAAA